MHAVTPQTRLMHRQTVRYAGFSLVEVCLALGIVAFALIPLVGLLSVGLDSYRNSNMRGRAAQAVGQVTSCIQLAKVVTDPSTGQSTGVYVAAAPMDNINITRSPVDASQSGVPPMHWSLATDRQSALGAKVQYTVYFDANGQVVAANANPQLVAMVILTPPTSAFDTGFAQIAVAWPVITAPTYNSSSGIITFANPQGHEESTIPFISIPP